MSVNILVPSYSKCKDTIFVVQWLTFEVCRPTVAFVSIYIYSGVSYQGLRDIKYDLLRSITIYLYVNGGIFGRPATTIFFRITWHGYTATTETGKCDICLISEQAWIWEIILQHIFLPRRWVKSSIKFRIKIKMNTKISTCKHRPGGEKIISTNNVEK